MRLTRTSSIAAAAVLAVSGSAFAAATQKQSRSATLRANSHLSSGKLTLTTTNKPKGKRFGVRIDYDVMVKSRTVLAFFAYPCRSNKCTPFTTQTATVLPGHRVLKFTGSVPIVKKHRDGKTIACVYAQLRDRGPNGTKPGAIVRRANGSKGLEACTTF